MKIKLSSFRDLGKCSYATLMDEFDTEKNHIYLLDNSESYAKQFLEQLEVKITSVEDLFPYLWAIPCVHVSDKESGSKSWFSYTGTWWDKLYPHYHNDYRNERLVEVKAKLIEENKTE